MMIKIHLLLFLCLLCWQQTRAQYQGGGGEGNGLIAIFSTSLISPLSPFTGGSNDGNSFRLGTTIPLTSSSAFSGGAYHGSSLTSGILSLVTNSMYNGSSDDGEHYIITNNISLVAIVNSYSGGNDDGEGSSIGLAIGLSTINNMYSGGIADGSVVTLANILPLLTTVSQYNGGADDGMSSLFSPSIPSSVIYVFDGSGNWDIPSNWSNNLIPPSPLPTGAQIIINPFNGNCILNVSQVIGTGATISISPGKNLIIPGTLQ